ncbi:Gp49 family protein [Mesorhizobium sp.]|uniref:Gp49 family protein n=1 Tax=Mesorhizobium sp. TaxID=1871066 RepID=UPI0025CCD2E0|nr:Gp49 family protein [Mesorhizobium sp.]
MNKPVTEKELIEKSTGERVTLEAVESNIVACTFTRHGLMIVCFLDLKNGFTVTGQSACADPKNFNEEIGQRLARADAVNKMWALMGYELKSRIVRDQKMVDEAPVKPGALFATYIGTKVINAIPMDRLAYNQLRGWKLPANENGADEGYLVEYTDRIENPPHVPGFRGYISWSPKDVFERAYRPVGVAAAQPQATSAEGTEEASNDDAEPFLIAYVSEDGKEVGIEHDTEADWGKVYMGHVVLRDRLNERIAQMDKCPAHPHKATGARPTLIVLDDAEETYKKEYADSLAVRKEETWVDRAKVELIQLTDRYDKLETFLRTEAFERLPTVDRKDLYVQVNAMEGYKHALAKRVARAELNNSMTAQRDAQQAQRQQFQNKAAE